MQTSDPLIGQHLSSFLIQQALGRGGMARVYKGIDLSLHRTVAIKVIDEGLRANNTYTQRFEREAQAVANLKHPNIVTIFHFGQHESLYYLVMEYIDGADLDTIVRNYKAAGELMPYTDVIRILEAIASALDAAHQQGVIHRDVKPSNIMLERDGRPVLTDFGLALRVSEGTMGDAFGSPHYISPEQARNSASVVPQSDLYSLAVVAYELLSGVVPFDDPSPTALAMQHIMAAVPSPRSFNQNLSEAVEQVLLKGLAKTPEERYATGAEFASALRRALDRMNQGPAQATTLELPPSLPGISVPLARRLSMQTARDKVSQELALTSARGQALTHYPDSIQPKQRNSRLPYLITVAGALMALAVAALILTKLLGTPVPAALVSPTAPETSTRVAAAFVVSPTIPIPVASSTVMPTATLPPPSLTPTLTMQPTTVQPTATPVPPTMTPMTLPTASPIVVPTVVPVTPQVGSSPAAPPTVLYPDGRRFVFIWDEKAFYAANQSGQRVPVANMVFERLRTNGSSAEQYAGSRWTAYYAFSEPNKCLILKIQGTYSNLPRSDCPYGYNSEINVQDGEVFWTPSNDLLQFRILWNKSEVGRCDIAQRRCEIRLPPA